jgi:hypothetical protein
MNYDEYGSLKMIKTVSFDLVIDAYLKRECPLVKGTNE